MVQIKEIQRGDLSTCDINPSTLCPSGFLTCFFKSGFYALIFCKFSLNKCIYYIVALDFGFQAAVGMWRRERIRRYSCFQTITDYVYLYDGLEQTIFLIFNTSDN